MKAYIGQTRGAKLIAQLTQLGFGEMTQPDEYPPRRAYSWVADNGAFKLWSSGKPFDGERFLANLFHSEGWAIRPDWIVCPDVVADAPGTRRLWSKYQPLLRPTAPVYFVAQDGLTDADARAVLKEADGLFVGGSLPWKLSEGQRMVRLAHEAGKPCHIGRVGGAPRVIWAKGIGADSIDSCTPLFSRDNLRRFCTAFFSGGYQPDLFAPDVVEHPGLGRSIPKRKPKVPTAPVELAPTPKLSDLPLFQRTP